MNWALIFALNAPSILFYYRVNKTFLTLKMAKGFYLFIYLAGQLCTCQNRVARG